MQYTFRFFKLDERGKITHMAGVAPGKKQPNIECTPDNIKWCPIKRAQLEFEIGEMRRKLDMFAATSKMWTVPDTPPPHQLNFANVRQILNPHGGGTHTCELAGAAICFIKDMLEVPRFQDWAGNIYLCGIDYIDNNDPGKAKSKPPPEPESVDELLEREERRECGFTRGVAGFNAYVEWIGKTAQCADAAQCVVLAVDKLMSALKDCGINDFAVIGKAIDRVVGSLEIMCRALAKAEAATGNQCQAGAKTTQTAGTVEASPKRGRGRPRKPDGAAHFIFTPERKEAAVQIIEYRRNNPTSTWIQCAEKVAEENPDAKVFEIEKNFMAWARGNGTTRTELENLSDADWDDYKNQLK